MEKEIKQDCQSCKDQPERHAQGHICPDCVKWLKMGPQGLLDQAEENISVETKEQFDQHHL